jgi:lipid II:glycine glycyltransferase (peptidoglycan interpeptide bridge formation enzyme)
MGPHLTNQAVADAPTGGRLVDRPATLAVRVESRPDASTLDAWDRLVTRTPRSDVAQLSSWADVRRTAGYEPTFITARAGDDVLGGAMVLHRRLVPGLGPVAYLPLGPVLAPGAHRVEAMDAVCDAIADLARHYFSATFVQPMTGDLGVSDRLLRRGFRRSAAGIAPVASIAVDVAEPYAGLRSGTRASIKRAAREGVQVRRADATDLPLVAGLLAETAEHHHFSAASLEHLQGLHEALAPGGHLQIFLAERDGTPLAADVLTGSGGVLTLRLTGMRRDPETRKIGAAALLRWRTMLWARANGYDAVDLGGIPPTAVDALRAGHSGLAARVDGRTYFKASFGGEAFHRPEAVELLSTPVRLGHDQVRRSPQGGRLVRAAARFLRGSRHR